MDQSYYVQLYHGTPDIYGCYSCAGECYWFKTKEEAVKFFEEVTKDYAKKEVGFYDDGCHNVFDEDEREVCCNLCIKRVCGYDEYPKYVDLNGEAICVECAEGFFLPSDILLFEDYIKKTEETIA